MEPTEGPQVVAEVVRGLRGGEPFVESRHHGTIIGLHRDGAPAFVVGAPDRPVLPRSAVKPLQAAAMIRARDKVNIEKRKEEIIGK